MRTRDKPLSLPRLMCLKSEAFSILHFLDQRGNIGLDWHLDFTP